MTKTLVETIKKRGALRNPRVEEAFERIDREDFVPEEFKKQAGNDVPLPIGYAQTISQPFTVAFMLELLDPKPGEKILDVGSGSGWTTALLGYLVGDTGRVTGVEIIPDLVEFGKSNLAKYAMPWTSIVEAEKRLGLKAEAPYDKILVSAATKRLPDELVDQLAVGGTMVIPVEYAIWQVKKISDDETEIKKYEGFVFVPLTKKD